MHLSVDRSPQRLGPLANQEETGADEYRGACDRAVRPCSLLKRENATYCGGFTLPLCSDPNLPVLFHGAPFWDALPGTIDPPLARASGGSHIISAPAIGWILMVSALLAEAIGWSRRNVGQNRPESARPQRLDLLAGGASTARRVSASVATW